MRSALIALLSTMSLVACRDLSGFTTKGDRYEGSVVSATFVRAGVADGTTACLSIDMDHLQDTPGKLSTSDGRFKMESLRPIPQIWHDPLSTLSFGEGRDKNLVYVASPAPGFADGGETGDVLVVVSLMNSGGVEVRLLRGAGDVFAIFDLVRQSGPCSY